MAAALNAEVDACLVTCGLGAANARRFASRNGIESIDAFGTLFDETQTTDMIKIHNETCGTPADRKLGIGHGNKLKALIHWVKDRQRRQIVVLAADWTTAALTAAIESVRNSAIVNKAKAAIVEVGQIDTGLKWYKWDGKFMMQLESMRSTDGSQSCRYLARRPKPVGWDPVTDAADDKERLMYQVSLSGATFELDNARAWIELKKVTIMSASYTWIKAHEGDFRAAYLALVTICEGPDHQNKRLTLANRAISLDKAKGGVFYVNEYAVSFMDYSTELLEAYEIISLYRNDTAPETMVTRLLAGMTAGGGVDLTIAKNHVDDNLLGNYQSAITYLSNKVTAIFPPKTGGNPNRSASQAQGDRNSGLEQRMMNGHKVPFFNGINVSNVTKYFNNAEMKTLGKTGREYIFSKRPAGGGGRGPGRGGRYGRGGRFGRGGGRERHGGYGRGGERQSYGDDNRNVRSAHYNRHERDRDDQYDDRRRDDNRSESRGYHSDDSRFNDNDDRSVRQQRRRDDGDGVPGDGTPSVVTYPRRRGGGDRDSESRSSSRGGQAGGSFGRGAYGRGGARR